MEYSNFYEIEYQGIKTNCFIIELNSFNNDKSKRYYCIQKNEIIEMFKIQSIGTLVEYLDKYGLDLVQLQDEESKRKIYGMLKDYIDAKDVINNENDLYEYMNVNTFNNDSFDIKNAHPLIDNKIANFKNLTEYDYKLLKEYKNVDKYIFNIKGNEDEKRK